MLQRIQRQRTKGWRMPEGAVYVGRPSLLGNPFGVDTWGLDMSIRLYRETVSGGWNPKVLDGYTDDQYDDAYDLAMVWRKRFGWPFPAEGIRHELAGRDLACWCPLSSPCHADVLLEIANRSR